MFDFIADLLKKYKEKYKQNEKIFGSTYITDYKDFICLMDNGELVKPDYVDRTFSRILKENGFRHIRLHDLRHSCATLLLRNGVPLPEIQKWLGHSNIVTTQRYSHLDQNDKSIPANMIETKFNMSFVPMIIKKNKYLLALDKCSKEYISKHFLNLHKKLKSVRKNVRKICIFYKLKPQAYLTNYLRF